MALDHAIAATRVFLAERFRTMMGWANPLPVRAIPEQFLIAAVWDDVVHLARGGQAAFR
jgi:hypothetical protein